MPKVIKFKNKTKNFIETGSYIGDGIQLAIDSGFEKIYSIEISEDYYSICKDRFINNKNVEMIKGDSFYELEKIINDSEVPFTYWLDGHYSGGKTGFGELEFPIMIELESILKRGINGEIIYIDDMRILRNYSEDINEYKMREILSKYKKEFTITFENSEHSENDIMIFEY